MSRVRSGMSDHPLKYKNETGATMPAFGIFNLVGGARVNGELIPGSALSAATGEEALYVNSALAIADDGYGNCRSCNDGPFWVRYNTSSAPANGDVVGPVGGETYVDATGTGLVVIFKDTAKELVLCEKLGGGGACRCVTVHELVMVGTPTGGTIILNVGVDDGSGITTESITLDYNENAAGALSAFEGHSEIASGDITVKGGPFPAGALYVVYKSSGALNRDQPIPTTNTNSLTGGTSPHLEYRYVTNQDWEA